jgi:tetratricopeptide (TPR) repeat protein
MWRVFISHTSELREFPRGTSYVTAVKEAISAAGHVIVDMANFAAADQAPAQLCIDKVRGSDVYLGVLGTRYGSPVRDKPEVSYTELEFNTATEAGRDRLVFLLDTDADDVGIPLSRSIDHAFGARQDAFRRRVQDSGLTTQSFASPAQLGQLVERSLRELAETRTRLASGIQHERVPAEPQPVRASKFVNPPPMTAPAWFQDRQVETGLLAKYVTDPGIRLVCVSGRGGIGKTAMVCRLLKGLEAGRIPDVEGESAAIAVGGIVYLCRDGVHQVEYPTLVADLLQLLPADTAQPLQHRYQDAHRTPREMMRAVLDAFPAGEPVVVLLDNLESVMDTEHDTLTDPALHEALTAVLTAPEHAVTVIATTRVTPVALLKIEPSRQREQRLNKGLGSEDAQIVLRDLDDDGHLGLRDAPGEVLDGLHRYTRGFPRALEAVKAILDADPTLGPRDLLDRIPPPEDQVVRVLVGEAYDRLDGPAKQVMQALAVYPAPVSAVGVDFLLRPVDPTTDAAPILVRLVRRQLVRFQDGRYYLHPVDREYARGRLSRGSPGDSPAAFTRTGLQARAAEYYAQIRTPRESWHTLEDVRPQLAEFELRCDTGDYDTAAAVLAGIDFDYLRAWGHYRMLIGLHRRIHGRITDPILNAGHLSNLAATHVHLGEYRQAIDLYAQALAVARDIGERQLEGSALVNLGNCHADLGEYQQAFDLHTQALAVARGTSERQLESSALVNLGNCHACLGEYQQALGLHTQALAIARDIGDRRGEGTVLVNLGNCYHRLGEYQRAIDRDTEALAIARDIGDSYEEAIAVEYLGRARLASGEARLAVTLLEQAVSIANTTGDIEPAVEARSWLARAHLQLDDPEAALAATTARRELLYPTEQPMLRLLEGLALLDLHRLQESVSAFSAAVTAADALLALADNNVAALQARALAVSGLAAATDSPAQAVEAGKAFTEARAVTSAPGVVAGTRRLLEQIASHDRSGVLAEVRAAQDQLWRVWLTSARASRKSAARLTDNVRRSSAGAVTTSSSSLRRGHGPWCAAGAASAALVGRAPAASGRRAGRGSPVPVRPRRPGAQAGSGSGGRSCRRGQSTGAILFGRFRWCWTGAG